MSRQVFQVYLGTNDITSKKASDILERLNSLNSVEEIMSVIGIYGGQKVVGMRIARRILNTKTKIGEFQDLNQVATVPGIGSWRFAIIMSALCDNA